MRMLLSFVLGVWLVGGFAPANASGADDFRLGGPLPGEVLDAWERRRAACPSVHWKLQYRELVTKGLLNASPESLEEHGPLPKQDEWREREFETWIDFPTQRIRHETRGQMHHTELDGTIQLGSLDEVRVFDGQRFQYFLRYVNQFRELDPDGELSPNLVFESMLRPCFWSLGMFFGPDTPAHIKEFHRRVDPKKFRIHAVQRSGGSTQLVVRVDMFPGRPGNYDELTIDVERDGAIVKNAMIADGELRAEINVDWARTDSGWQPESWKCASYRPDGALAMGGEGELVERTCSPDLSQIEFHMTPAPGIPYWVEKTDTVMIKSVAGEADIPKELFDIQQSARQRRWNWLLSGGVLLAALVGVVWWRRRRFAVA